MYPVCNGPFQHNLTFPCIYRLFVVVVVVVVVVVDISIDIVAVLENKLFDIECALIPKV